MKTGLLVVGVFLFSAIAAAGPTIHGNEHASCRSEIRKLETTIRNLKQDAKQKDNEIVKLKRTVSASRQELQSLQAKLDAVNADTELHAAKCPIIKKARAESAKHQANLAKGKLFNGMTVDEANKLMGTAGTVVAEENGVTTYRWDHYDKLRSSGSTPVAVGGGKVYRQATYEKAYSGSTFADFRDGKLVRWYVEKVP